MFNASVMSCVMAN